MNESVGLLLVPIRNSLILMGLMLRTFSVVVVDWRPPSVGRPPLVGFVHATLPIRSPSNATGPEVTVKVALTLAPGATESNFFVRSEVPFTTEVHLLAGSSSRNSTPTCLLYTSP